MKGKFSITYSKWNFPYKSEDVTYFGITKNSVLSFLLSYFFVRHCFEMNSFSLLKIVAKLDNETSKFILSCEYSTWVYERGNWCCGNRRITFAQREKDAPTHFSKRVQCCNILYTRLLQRDFPVAEDLQDGSFGWT